MVNGFDKISRFCFVMIDFRFQQHGSHKLYLPAVLRNEEPCSTCSNCLLETGSFERPVVIMTLQLVAHLQRTEIL